jgi:hypothetical protein
MQISKIKQKLKKKKKRLGSNPDTTSSWLWLRGFK